VIAVNLNSDLVGKRRTPKVSPRNIPPKKEKTSGKLREQLTAYLDSAVKRGKFLIPAKFLLDGSNRDPSLFEVMATATNIMQDRITRQRLGGILRIC